MSREINEESETRLAISSRKEPPQWLPFSSIFHKKRSFWYAYLGGGG
jgi:hypothetical protein